MKSFLPLSSIAIGLLALAPALHAQESDQAAELAKQLNNPVAALISVPFQANEDFKMGPTGKGYQFKLNFQPVIPISVSQEWNVIIRTVVPYINQKDVFYREVPSFPGLPDSVLNGIPRPLRGRAEDEARRQYDHEVKNNPQNRSQEGLGDTTQSFFLSPKAPGPGGLIWGLGPVLLYPTATQDLLGSGRFGLGPTFVGLVQKGGWTTGLLANQIWSVAGNEERRNVNSMFLQPFVSYTTKSHTSFVVNTESTYNWEDSQWTVPLNLMVSQVLKIGKQPVSIQLGGRYYAEGPSGAPEWGLRLSFTLLFPTGKHEAPAPSSYKK